MSIPTHGPSCQTLVYPTSCWYCQQEIFVLECSCGSAVLFDQIGASWPKHTCVGYGRGRWSTVATLRASGAPITSDVIQGAEPETEIKRIDPMAGELRSLLAVVRDLHSSTKRTETVKALPEFGSKLFGLNPKMNYWQITLVDNRIRPNESFTALIPDPLTHGLKHHVMVRVEMSAHVIGDWANWIINDINPL